MIGDLSNSARPLGCIGPATRERFKGSASAVVENVSESFGDQLDAAIRKRMANHKEGPAQKVIDGKATEIKPLVRRI
jgi:hypothetical protein